MPCGVNKIYIWSIWSGIVLVSGRGNGLLSSCCHVVSQTPKKSADVVNRSAVGSIYEMHYSGKSRATLEQQSATNVQTSDIQYVVWRGGVTWKRAGLGCEPAGTASSRTVRWINKNGLIDRLGLSEQVWSGAQHVTRTWIRSPYWELNCSRSCFFPLSFVYGRSLRFVKKRLTSTLHADQSLRDPLSVV